MVECLINKWLNILELYDWNVVTEEIDRLQVMFPDDIDEDDYYFIGICHEKHEAVIFHDRELTEEDIIHELLHVKFNYLSEDMINEFTYLFLNAVETKNTCV